MFFRLLNTSACYGFAGLIVPFFASYQSRNHFSSAFIDLFKWRRSYIKFSRVRSPFWRFYLISRIILCVKVDLCHTFFLTISFIELIWASFREDFALIFVKKISLGFKRVKHLEFLFGTSIRGWKKHAWFRFAFGFGGTFACISKQQLQKLFILSVYIVWKNVSRNSLVQLQQLVDHPFDSSAMILKMPDQLLEEIGNLLLNLLVALF